MKERFLVVTMVLFGAVACTSNEGTGGDGDGDSQSDASIGDGDGDGDGDIDASSVALCAEPGAIGNEEGVGKYCQTDGDCSGQAAGLCTVTQQADAPPFCTKICFDSSTCGAGASCEGDGPIKGCTPDCVVNGDRR